MPYSDPEKEKQRSREYYSKNRERIIRRACEYQKAYYIKKDRSNDKHARDEMGRFVFTTGSTRYRTKITNGKQKLEHRAVYESYFGKIPDGIIIHHINGNKKDNRIENLQAVTATEHNRIHARPPWNKGVVGYKVNYNYESVKKRQKRIVCIENNIEFESVNEAGLTLNISRSGISDALHGRRKTVGGLSFRFAQL
jgi:hypothetical protein